MLGFNDTIELGYEHVGRPEEIANSLPRGPYPSHFQPTYSNRAFLLKTIGELQATTPVTTLDEILATKGELADASHPDTPRPVVTSGECSERINPVPEWEDPNKAQLEWGELVLAAYDEFQLVKDVLSDAIYFRRLFQNAKPRSSEHDNGVVSYMGDGVNDIDRNKREPDPRRLVEAAVQARDLMADLGDLTDGKLRAAHEALLLVLERSFLMKDKDDNYFLSSAVRPWIGWRTNHPKSPHVELFSEIVNPVAAKIGPNSDAKHIEALSRRLNPHHERGRLTFMLRVGNDRNAMRRILPAIWKYAPEAGIEYDEHGSTIMMEEVEAYDRKPPKIHKVRAVSRIIDDIELLASMCQRYGLLLNGIHLETTMDNTRQECVDEVGQLPRDSSLVDPLLNPRQTEAVLRAFADIFYSHVSMAA